MNGRAFVTPQDVKDLAHDVLRHRILLTYEAEAEDITTDAILERILAKVPGALKQAAVSRPDAPSAPRTDDRCPC